MSICIHKDPSKFIHNASMSCRDAIISNTDGKLYELYFRYKFNNLLLVINSHLSNEIRNFIIEFGNQCNVVLYHKLQPQEDIMNEFGSIKHIINCPITQKNNTQHVHVLPKLMVNTEVFYNMHLPRNSKYCVFLDNIDKPPSSLMNLLYPNTNLPINIFNAPHFAHPQNLGILRGEVERADILNQYEYFIDIDKMYLAEASECQCKIMQIVDSGALETAPEITQDIIEYKTFLQDIFV